MNLISNLLKKFTTQKVETEIYGIKAVTTEPDFRFQTKDAWQRYIAAERYMASNKVTWIKAQELFQPRIKNQLFA